MKIDEQLICEYIFDLVDVDQEVIIKNAIEADPEIQQEYLRLKNKFERLKLLENDYPNPLIALSQFLVKKSAVAAILILGSSLWFLPNQAHATAGDPVAEFTRNSVIQQKVYCTSGISPQKSHTFVNDFDTILAKNIQVSPSIDPEMNYSTQYFKKLSL